MRHTVYYRVSGCLSAAGRPTSVGIRAHDRLQELLRFAYGDKSIVNNAVRAASRDLSATPARAAEVLAAAGDSWSKAVVDKAASKLAGAYSPAKAEALQAAQLEAERLAAENNEAWAGV